MAAKKKKTTKKNPEDELKAHRKAMIAIFFCGLFAVSYAVVEGLILKSSAVLTGPQGTFTMDPITSILFILGGLIGIGFAIWGWFTPPKR